MPVTSIVDVETSKLELRCAPLLVSSSGLQAPARSLLQVCWGIAIRIRVGCAMLEAFLCTKGKLLLGTVNLPKYFFARTFHVASLDRAFPSRDFGCQEAGTRVPGGVDGIAHVAQWSCLETMEFRYLKPGTERMWDQ